MLAVFEKTQVKVPAGLDLCEANGKGGTPPSQSGMELIDAFKEKEVTTKLGCGTALAYSISNQQPSRPRAFACIEGIFVLWKGYLQNLHQLRQLYGITRQVSDEQLVVEVYKALRDRAPYPTDQAIRHFKGPFAFVLYDSKSGTVFAATDTSAEGANLHWGCAADGSLVFADDASLLQGCGACVAPFPNGCLFSSQTGLVSYDKPNCPLTAMPKVNSSGQLCGTFFKVDSKAEIRKMSSSMRHVGSDATF